MNGQERFHYVRVRAIGGYDGSACIWLSCTCGWESDSTESMDTDLIATTVAAHRKTEAPER